MTPDNPDSAVITLEGLTAWTEIFQKRQDASDKRQEIQSADISDLTRDVGKLTATVQALVDNQKGIFHRQNRPLPLGAIIGAFTLLVIMAGLLIAPMHREQDRSYMFDVKVMEYMLSNTKISQEHTTDIKWLKLMELRLNSRIHRVVEALE